ncbi:MAG: hypothetical protein AB1847_23470 [bacterium]
MAEKVRCMGMAENLDEKVRKNLETLFRFTEQLHHIKHVPEKDARNIFGITLQPLIETDYFKLERDVIMLGANAPTEQNARRLRHLMNHFLIMGIIWNAWSFEKTGKADRRKKIAKYFSSPLGLAGIISFTVDRDRMISISNKLAERGLLVKSFEGRRNVYLLSPWFRAYFPALLEKIQTAEEQKFESYNNSTRGS